jgi:hypothetical protein
MQALTVATASLPRAIFVSTISLSLVNRWPMRTVYERVAQLLKPFIKVASSMSRHLTPDTPFFQGSTPACTQTPRSSM